MAEKVKSSKDKKELIEKAYKKSIEFLKKCSTKYGFIASITKRANYRRVWARDGCITGISALLSGEEELIKTFKQTLITLGKHQGRQGQIPSNVDAENEKVSYGITSGRVDASIWYVIGGAQYYKFTKDKKFLKEKIGILEKTMNILEAWEYNQKDFLFVPESGDWADETSRHGYILYDQLLYYKAICEYSYILNKIGKKNDFWKEKSERLRKKIVTNFWIKEGNIDKQSIYHPEIFDKAYREYSGKQNFWLENFHHNPLFERFDAFANILTIILDFSDKNQTKKIFDYISHIIGAGYLVPAFFPVISPEYEEAWRKMKSNYSFHFKNRPYHSHNGGLWAMLTGFYIRALIKNGKKDLAHQYLFNIALANSLSKKGEKEWGFYEYHHGLRRVPGGTRGLAWSAGACIMGYKAFKGEKIFK